MKYEFTGEIINYDNFNTKSTIKTQEQFNRKIKQVVETLLQYTEFSKYADDLENCL